jgi:peptidoglycan/LPS O-acetylase OafA/YrhL
MYFLISFVFLDNYYNIRLFYGVAVFNLLFYYKDYFMKKFFYKPFVKIGNTSLWIFLTHFFIIDFLYFSIITSSKFGLWFGYFWVCFFSLVFSIPVGFLFKEIYEMFLGD